MNRLVCRSSEPIDRAALPPTTRAGPARVLFLHALDLGFGTTTRNLIDVAGRRPDLDAVHCGLQFRGPLRQLMRSAPPLGRWDLRAARMMHASALAIGRLLGPGDRFPLPLERFDVVHIMTQQRALIATRLGGHGRKPGRPSAKFVVNADATTPAYDRAFEYRSRAPKPEIALERRIFNAADAVACSSRWVADSVAADFGVPRERLFLHLPCVFPPAGGARPRIADPSRPVRVVFVGNDWERKGGPRLLAWHQRRWADLAELHVCSGKAVPDRSARGVVWHGATPHERLIREILPAMDLMVMPTREDTFLIAAQEAQALGLPVVTSRLAGIPEVVADGVSGLLCDRHDDDAFVAAVERLLDDPGLRERLSRGALDHAERHLSARIWHDHLMDQLVSLADGRPVRFAPAEPTATAPQPDPAEAAT